MDDSLKFYFLAEECGWDCSSYAFAYREKLLSSGAYQVLSINILGAKNHLSYKAQQVCESFNSLNKEPKTLKEAFILENTINYLALHSFPEYYLNPLAIHPTYSGDVTTLGDLILDIQGKEQSINEWIMDESVPLDTKKEEVNSLCDEYLLDMNHLVEHSISLIKQRAFSKGDRKNDIFLKVIEIFFFVLLHLFFGVLLLYPFEAFRTCLYHFDAGKIMSYLWIVFPLTLLFFDVAFVAFHSYKAKISEPYNYARRFLRTHASRVYDDLKVTRDKLYNYLCGAINNRLILQNDIKDFSRLSSSYVDFDKVIRVEDLKNRKAYRILRNLLFAFGTIAYLTAVFTMVVYLIGLIFGAAI